MLADNRKKERVRHQTSFHLHFQRCCLLEKLLLRHSTFAISNIDMSSSRFDIQNNKELQHEKHSKTSGIIHFRAPTLQQSLLVTTKIWSSLNDCGVWELVNHLPTMTSNLNIVDLRSDLTISKLYLKFQYDMGGRTDIALFCALPRSKSMASGMYYDVRCTCNADIA